MSNGKIITDCRKEHVNLPKKKKKRENEICTTVIQLLYAIDMTAAVEATTVLHRLQVKTGTVIHYKCQTVPMNSVIQCLTALASFHSII